MAATADLKAALARIADKHADSIARADLRFFTVAVRLNPRTGRPATYRVDCTFEGELEARNGHDRDFSERPTSAAPAEAFSRSGSDAAARSGSRA